MLSIIFITWLNIVWPKGLLNKYVTQLQIDEISLVEMEQFRIVSSPFSDLLEKFVTKFPSYLTIRDWERNRIVVSSHDFFLWRDLALRTYWTVPNNKTSIKTLKKFYMTLWINHLFPSHEDLHLPRSLLLCVPCLAQLSSPYADSVLWHLPPLWFFGVNRSYYLGE